MRFCLAFGALSALTAALLCSVACKHKEAEPAASSKSWQFDQIFGVEIA